MTKYKPKDNAYFTGVFNGESVIIMSKHYSLKSAKEKAHNDLKYDESGKSTLFIFKVVGEMKS